MKSFRTIEAVEITTMIGCPVRCYYCPQDQLIARASKLQLQDNLSFNLFKKIIDKIPTGLRIHFSGMSEPFANPETIDMIEFAIQKGHSVRIFSTLFGLSVTDVQRLSGLPLNNWNLSVHLFKSLFTQSQTSIYKEIILILSRLKENVHFHSHSQNELVWLSLGLKDVKILPSTTRAGALRKSQIKRGPIRCFRNLQPVLMPDGEAFLCCMDWKLMNRLGNILRDGFDFIGQCNAVNKIINSWSDESSHSICRQCEYSICQ